MAINNIFIAYKYMLNSIPSEGGCHLTCISSVFLTIYPTQHYINKVKFEENSHSWVK